MPDSRAEPPTSKAPASNAIYRVPRATYRLQLRSDFGLDEVRKLLPDLHDLGISDVYLSPLFRARADSSHGYDVVDHGAIDPAFGKLSDFESLAAASRELGMGILLDIVPNHMGINDAANHWWQDVLEHGPAATHAEFFDIDWSPAAAHLKNKVLLPFLREPFGEALEGGKLRLAGEQGRLQLAYGEQRYPLARGTLPPELVEAAARLPDSDVELDAALAEFNGHVGEPQSFDRLESLLDKQWYRLASWRVAAEEINYRRFFDIDDLAAIRVEDPRVFDAVHRLVAHLLGQGWITGLRIDHPDGLYDPAGYFAKLQKLWQESRGEDARADASHGQLFMVAEKILSADEELPSDWPVCGTTGYDFMNLVSRLLVDLAGVAKLRREYARLTGVSASPAEVAYESKREVLRNSLASELGMLVSQLDRIAHAHRASRDFTRAGLEHALSEVIACLAVYRTYVPPRGWDVGEGDFRQVATAVRLAKRRNPDASHAVFDFVGAVLRLENPATLTIEQAEERRRLALKVQQVSGPAMAKGLEDTAFYRYFPLAALNEVGGELDARPLAVEDFHRLMERRAAEWPHSMSATATHDTKRGEDQRARLLVLSEIAEEWIETVRRWQGMSAPLRELVNGEPAPDRNGEYLLYQTLVGTWPTRAMQVDERGAYSDRIVAYLRKALREAKQFTSWRNPWPEYEAAVATFVRRLLADEGAAGFRAELDGLVRRIAVAGAVNGLSQALLKIALPGVPDFYQGAEFWDFNLVDPDNRRPVDFDARRSALKTLRKEYHESPLALAKLFAADLTLDRAKQFVIWRALAARQAHAEIFQRGGYVPLAITGARESHVFAFAREFAGRWIAVVVPRQIQCLRLGPGGAIDWQDTQVALPPDAASWRHELTSSPVNNFAATPVGDLLAPLPVALLTSP